MPVPAEAHRDSDRLDPGIWKVSAVVLLGPFMTNLDSTVVNVSLSTLARELHASLSSIQWVVSGYLLALALMLPMSGWLVDRIGAKRVYLGCFTAFTIASVFCGTAHSSDALIACRVVQGMAGGLLSPMAQMMIARVAGRQMARVLGFTVMPILISPILGPVIAGEVLQHGSWRWLFFLNLPIGVLAVALASVLLPKDESTRQPRRFDLKGFLLLSPGLVAMLYGLEHAMEGSGRISLGLGVLLLGGFLVYAKRMGAAALVDLELFSSPVFSAAAMLQFLSNAMIFSGQMLLPLYLISVCHFSTEKTGAVVMSLGLGMLCSYPFMGMLTERFGCRPVSSSGSLIAFAGTLLIAWMAWRGVDTPVLCAALFLRGMGMGAIGIPTISAAYSSVPKERLPIATTTINIVQRIGGPIGTTLFAIFLGFCAQQLHLSGAPTFAAAFLLLAVIHASNFFCALRLPMRVHDTQAEKRLVKLETVGAQAE